MRGHLAGSIEDRGDRRVRQLPRQYANEIEDIGFDRPAGLPDLVLFDRQLGMVATLPMNDERQRISRDIDDNLFDK
jgi:hypothetical protein